MKDTRNLVLGVTLGDATGIGPELIVKALNDNEIKKLATWVIVDDKRVLKQGEEIAGSQIDIIEIEEISQVVPEDGKIYFIDLKNLDPKDYKLGVLSEKAGKASGDTSKYLLEISQHNKIDGVIYGPLNKEALQRGGHHFKDELHFFADLLNCKHGFGEINILDDLWICRVTSHIPMKEVSSYITKENVLDRIHFAHRNLTRAGYNNPKIAVASYNPHSGEGGLTGTEEIDAIIPAVKEAQKEGINVVGPYSADTIFLRLEKEAINCLLAMYHDQAQIGMKLMGFNRGVTMSAGLPVVLTTPAHGTAFDIAGKGIADIGPTKAAIKMLVRMNSNNKF